MCDNQQEKWKTRPLSMKCTLSGGYGFPDKFQGKMSSELPFIKVSDMNLGGNEKYIVHSNNYVSLQLAEKMRWTPFPVRTVVFAKVGAALKLNRRRVLTRPTLIDNNMMAAEALPGLDSTFLYHFLNTIDFGDFVQDGALPSINQNQVGCLEIPEIPTVEQHTIAAILDSMDEAIRRTEAVIAKLRQVKAGILNDLLTRGLDENGEPRDPLLHPEQFKDSPLGRIPKEWASQQMGEALLKKPSNGFSPREAVSFSGAFVLGLGCLTNNGFETLQLKPINPVDIHEENILHDGDLLISRSNTSQLVALPGVFRDIGYVCTYPDLMMRLVPKPCLLAPFLELLIRHSKLRNYLTRNANGTSASMVKINATTVIKSPVIFPERSEQERILTFVASLDGKLSEIQKEH